MLIDSVICNIWEVDAAASAVASDQKQVVRILKYVLEGNLK